MHSIVDTIRHLLLAWGYWAVALGLLLENMGVPVPGETILILASAVAFNHGELRLPWIILVGTIAATAGDNAGYWIGRKGGRPLLERWKRFFHVGAEGIASAERLIARYGAVAIFFARFVTGARVVAGPLAGVLRMEWRRFVLFNFLGAAVWVSAIAGAGYLFGSQFESLEHFFRKADIAIMVAVLAAGIYFWRRYKKKRRDRAPVSIHSPRHDAGETRHRERRRRIG